MAPVAALAERWARLWGTDARRAVEEVYSPGVVSADLADPADERHGHEPLLEAELLLQRRVPDRAVEILRLLEHDGRRAVLECLVTGTSSLDPARMAAPALLWWWLDDEGRVARQLAWSRWQHRRLDDGNVAGTLAARPRPPAAPRPESEADDDVRSQPWYRAFAEHLAETWSWDPVLADRSLYGASCTVESAVQPGRSLRGLQAIEAADAALARRLPLPDRRLRALDVLGEGRALAVRVSLEGRDEGRGPLRRAYGALVLTLDGSDRIVSNRTYLDWDGATSAEDAEEPIAGGQAQARDGADPPR